MSVMTHKKHSKFLLDGQTLKILPSPIMSEDSQNITISCYVYKDSLNIPSTC